MNKQDRTLTCRDCGNTFTFSIGEQNFYEEKGLAAPVRCRDCRNKRKREKQVQEEKTQEQKDAELEKLLAKFQANTILFEEEIERRERKKTRR